MSVVAQSPPAPTAKGPSKSAVAAAKKRVEAWYAGLGWKPFRYQRQVWNAYLEGRGGLVHATTGMGKTLSAWMGPLIEWSAANPAHAVPVVRGKPQAPPLTVLWITPLKALAGDTLKSLEAPVNGLGIPWRVEGRTGDTSQKLRARQRKALPTALVTTPESLTLFLTRADAREQFASLRLVVVDEWHELLASKRGTQTELALARLRSWVPELRTWGLSATLGNVEEAAAALCGTPARLAANASERSAPLTITGGRKKEYRVESLIPQDIERFPWAGHMGTKQLPAVVEAVESAESSLAFTNTRFQAEHWYQLLLSERPDWAGRIALHHGSLDNDTRHWVEDGLKEGRLKCVVCTSSLDLGVDFSPVDRVLNIGSPKGIGRMMQRAGRSGHAPGQPSRLTCVPTHAFELVENAAARDALEARRLEARRPLNKPIDVLVQHAVTCAVGGGFTREGLLEEVRRTAAYHKLTDAEWDWTLDFVTRGGAALKAYPEYSRVDIDEADRYVVTDKKVAQAHRMNVGTIAADGTLSVQFASGGRVGTVEESFASRLKAGDTFRFAGRTLEVVRMHEMKLIVKKSEKKTAMHPRWRGSRMPLSTELSDAVLERLRQAREDVYAGPEMTAVRPILELQKRWSDIPVAGELLIEQIRSREGHHLYIFPFAGRLVHEGLAAIVAYRMTKLRPITFAMSINDYGVELLSPDEPPLREAIDGGLFSPEGLGRDLLDSVNAAEMAKRQFREIARVSGLIYQNAPGAQRAVRQLQASTGLLFDVFRNYDPDNLLLEQSQREVLDYQLEENRLMTLFERLSRQPIRVNSPRRFTPLAFPLLVDRIREKVSSETLADRVRKLQESLEKAAG